MKILDYTLILKEDGIMIGGPEIIVFIIILFFVLIVFRLFRK